MSAASSSSSYLRLPRPTLWLVKGDTITIGRESDPDAPVREVEVGSFYVSRAPVTNEEYEAFDPAHERPPSSRGDRDPVVLVSFEDAEAYCRWYAEASGKPFRLPTEIEWEHACRAGTRTAWFWGDDWQRGAGSHAWCADNSLCHCHEVETLRANPFGLHDTLGNVWEWTAAEGAIASGAPLRAARGGSFRTREVHAATRLPLPPAERRDDLGFRIARSL